MKMSVINRLIFSTVLVGILLAGYQIVEATTYYVDNLLPGGDSFAGTTEASPFLTIQKCLKSATRPGDTCLVKNGTYNSSVQITFRHSGTAGNPITLKNYPGHSPVVNFSGLGGGGRILVSSANYLVPVSYGVIEGLEIKAGNDGIKIDNADHFIIRANNIHHNTMGVFITGGYQITLDRNNVWHNGDFATCATNPSACSLNHGFYIQGSFYTITNNVLYDNLAYAMTLTGHPYTGTNATWVTDANHAGFNNSLIANNTMAYQDHRAGIVMWDRNVNNNTIENNIFYENSQLLYASGSSQGIDFISCCGSGNIVRNNLSYGTGKNGNFTAGTGSGVSLSSPTTVNPLMVNAPATVPASPDFHLTSSSAAINAGSNLTANGIATDYDGNLRPTSGAWSLGAYEGASAPPAAPTGFKVF